MTAQEFLEQNYLKPGQTVTERINEICEAQSFTLDIALAYLSVIKNYDWVIDESKMVRCFGKDTGFLSCPVLALKESYPSLLTISLSHPVFDEIIKAADNHPEHVPGIRRLLLEALDLKELAHAC